MHKILKLALAFFVCCGTAFISANYSLVMAATRNVTPSGSSSSDCISVACSLARANTVVQPGDVVSLADGSYSTAINPAVSGTSSQRITYRAASSEATVINATLSSKSYITLENLNFISTAPSWVTSNASSTYITITNNTFDSYHVDGDPLNTSNTSHSFFGVNLQGHHHILRDNVFKSWMGGDTVQVHSDYSIVENNTFGDAGHGNIMMYGSYQIVRGNYLRNRLDRAMELSDHTGTEAEVNRLVENNIVFDSNWDRVYTWPTGMFREGAGDTGTDNLHKIGGSITIVRNNLIVGTNKGKDFNYNSIYHIGNYDTSYWWEHLRIYHNTLHDNRRNGISMLINTTLTGWDTRMTDNVIKNNIISKQDYYSIYIDNSNVPFSTHTFEGNILTQSIYKVGAIQSVATFDSNYSNANDNIGTLPTFVNEGIATTANNDPTDATRITFNDFALTSNSAGKGTGSNPAKPLTTVTANATNDTSITVGDAYYFFDGYTLETGDTINIGGDVVTVTAVNSKTNMTVNPAVTVASGDPIYLADYGTSPDRGVLLTSASGEANQAPSVSLIALSPDPNTDTTPSVTGTVSDSDGTVLSVEYQMDSNAGTWSTCSLSGGNFSCSVSPALSDGAHTVYVRATDNDGLSSTIQSDTFVIDTAAPNVSVVSLDPDPSSSSTPTLTGTATDTNSTVASVSYQVGSTAGTWKDCTALDGTFDEAEESFSCTISPALSDGSYSVYFKAADALGNATSSDYQSDSFSISNASGTWIFNNSTAANYTYDASLITVDNTGAHPVSGVNKLTNPSFGSDTASWSTASINPTSGWAAVPGNATYSVSDFMIMQYEAKYDCTGDGVGDTALTCNATASAGLGVDWRDVSQTTANVVSSAAGAPIVHIRQNQATSACPAGTHLLTNNEWMTIARNAEVQSANWADGVVGSTIAAGGGLKRGNAGVVDSTSYDGAQDPDYGTARNAKAKLVLSNGSEIWDLSGNVFEWMNNTVQRKDQPLAWDGVTDDATGLGWSDYASGASSRYIKSYKAGSPLQSVDILPSTATYNSTNGIGKLYHYSDPADVSTTAYAYERGGYWTDSTRTGLFTLKAHHLVSYSDQTVGYRCASDPAAQTFSSNGGRASGGGVTVQATAVSDSKLYQSVNVGNTDAYDFSVYVYDSTTGNAGGTVSSSIAQLYYNGATVSTTYTNIGSGWWKLSGTLTGADEAREFGVLVKAGKTVVVDEFTLNKSGEFSVFNTVGHTVAGVITWDSFVAQDTASGSASVKYQLCANDGSICQANSSWQYWDGDSWETAANTMTHVNTEAELTTAALQALVTDTDKLSVKTVFTFEGSATSQLESISVTGSADTQAPVISVTPLVPDPTSNSTPTVSGSVIEGNSTVASVTYQLDGTAGSWAACSATDGVFDEASEDFSCTVAPAVADGFHTIYLIATDAVGNTTPTAGASTDSFAVDTTGPTTPGKPTLLTPSDDSTPTLTWTESSDSPAGLDAAPYTLQWSTDSSFITGVSMKSDTPNSNTLTEALADGTWYFRVKAVDLLGNESEFSPTATVVIDTTVPVAPTVLLTVLSPDPNNDSTPSLGGTAIDSDGIVTLVEYQLDSTTGLWANCVADDGAFDEASEVFTCSVATQLSDGAHTFYAKATDNDLETSSTESDTFTIDTTAPVVTVTVYTPDPGSDATPTVSGSVTDADGTVASVEYQMNSTAGSWSACTVSTGTFSCTAAPALSDGSNTIYLRGTDALANLTTANYPSDTFVIDATAPTIPGTPASQSPENDTTPTWEWTVSSDEGVGLAGAPYTVEWSTDSTFSTGVSTSTVNTASFTHATALADGSWYFRVKAADDLNNQSDYSANGSFTVNTVIPPTEPPVVSLTAVSPDPGTDSSPSISGTASDPDGTIAQVRYQVDSTMGSWSACTATDGSFDGASETFSCSVSPSLNDGSHTMYVRATADDDQIVTESDSFVIDSTAPTPPGTPSTTTPTTDRTPTWTWTASSDSGVGLASPAYMVEWSTDADFSGKTYSSTTASNAYTHTTDLALGTWYFRVKASDGLANASTYSETGSFTYTGPLAISSIVVDPGQTSATITWSTTIAASSQVMYGVADFTERSTTEADTASRVTSHSVTLSNLVACTRYEYSVRSVSADNNEVSSTADTFMTDGCTGETAVYDQLIDTVASSDEKTITLDIGSAQSAAITVPVQVSSHPSLTFQLFRLNKDSVVSTTGLPVGYAGIVGLHVYELRALSSVSSLQTAFDHPITVTFSYSKAAIDGYTEDSLVIFRWNGSSWTQLSNCTDDASANTITCTTSNFSTFALVGKATPLLASPNSTPARQTNTPSTTSGGSSGSSSNSSSNGPFICDATPPSSVPEIYQALAGRTSVQLYINPASGESTQYTVIYGYSPTDERFAATFAQNRPSGAVVHTIHELKPNTLYYFKVQAHNGCATSGYGAAFAAKTKRFFWQKDMVTTSTSYSLTTTTQTDKKVSVSRTPSESSAAISPNNQKTPLPTPISDTTRVLPSSTPAPKQTTSDAKLSFWQSVKNFFSGVFK